SDSLRGLGFAYNGDDFDDGTDGYGAAPPAVAFDFLKGPSADRDGVDNDYDGVTDEAGESLQMTSFVFYNGDATVMGNPVGPSDHYNYLRARWRDGKTVTFGGLGRGFSTAPTTMMYTGAPSSYWSEYNIDGTGQRNVPSDRRFIMATGPVRLEPGQSEDIYVAVLWARGSDRLSSVALLKSNADQIQAMFDGGSLTSTGTAETVRPSANFLVQTYPNPFSKTSHIRIDVERPGLVTIEVYDALGRNVGSVYDGPASTGRHVFEWEPVGLAAGLYVFRVATGGRSSFFPVVLQP
ncbi:MAG: T9SS type A sorting domain-containing protein, partial [Rhodothermales bacterium]|nr:T9SS type A sorting domain-containing protein [Rhodothermales bacterium]